MTSAATTLGATRRSALREFLAAVATIMIKELRSRMRGRRAFVVLTIYLGILALITYGVYTVVGPIARDAIAFGGGFGMPNPSAMIGQWIFILLSIFQLILVSFIAPAFTAGQISLEREKQTLDLLISTPLRPSAIVVGKLLAALAYVVLLIVAAVPISAIVLMYGGASVDDIVRQQVVLLATALGLGSIGLFYSALIKRTQAATVLTYITVLALTIGTVMIFIFWSVLLVQAEGNPNFGAQRRAPEQLVYVNPGVAMLDVVSYTESGGFGGITSTLGMLRGLDPGVAVPVAAPNGMMCEGDRCIAVDPMGGPIAPDVAVPNQNLVATSGYWWPRFTLSFVGLSALLTLASMRLVLPAGMRQPFRRRRSLVRPELAALGPEPTSESSPQVASSEKLPEPEP